MSNARVTLGAAVIVGVLVYPGCGSDGEEAYFGDRSRCWGRLQFASWDIMVAVIEGERDVAAALRKVEAQAESPGLVCPVTGKQYLANPNPALWAGEQRCDGSVALVCPEHHPSMPEGRRALLAYTFDGRMIELPKLPSWAIQSRGDNSGPGR